MDTPSAANVSPKASPFTPLTPETPEPLNPLTPETSPATANVVVLVLEFLMFILLWLRHRSEHNRDAGSYLLPLPGAVLLHPPGQEDPQRGRKVLWQPGGRD